MKIKLLTTSVLLFFSCSLVTAQADFILSPDVLVKDSDYKKYENQFVRYVSWLTTNSVYHPQRTKINAFVFKWIEGSPYITITVEAFSTDLGKKNEDLFLLFLACYTRFAIEHPAQRTDQLQCNLAALKDILHFYQNQGDLKKDKKLIRLTKKMKEGKLENWLEKHI